MTTALAELGLTQVAEGGLTVSEASRIIRQAIKDKSYRATPLGLEVARYIRWKRNEWGATKDTLRDYEAIGAKLALHYADLELHDLEPPAGTELLRECWDHYWGDRAPRTRRKVRSIWVDFFDWAGRERGMTGNPARALASPKPRKTVKRLFSEDFISTVFAHQDYLPDELGCELILKYAVRRAELARIRFLDFDTDNWELTLYGKGGKPRVVPIVEPAFWRKLFEVQQTLQPKPDHYLIGRGRKVGMVTYHYHDRELTPRTIHSWWYGCLERAGIVEGGRDGGGWKGYNMHRGRHTVATDILRSTGNIVAASKLLGHTRLSTTEEAYAEFDTGDLAAVLRSMRVEEDS